MKPAGPASETAPPTRIRTVVAASTLARRVRWPRPRAIWSPSDSTPKDGARMEAATGLPVFPFPKEREYFVEMKLHA